MKKLFLAICLLVGISCCLQGAYAQAPMQMQKRLVAKGSTNPPQAFGYIEYLPLNYETRTDWPIILYLHGAGQEMGDGSLGQLPRGEGQGIPEEINVKGRAIGAVIIAPQTDSWWNVDQLDELVEYSFSHYKVDRNRLAVTGLSMGGAGTWNYIKVPKYMAKVAAAMPMCAADVLDQASAERIVQRNMPIWAFHAQDDPGVSYSMTAQSLAHIAIARGAKPDHDFMAGYPWKTNDVMTAHVGVDGVHFAWDYPHQDYRDAKGKPFKFQQLWTFYPEAWGMNHGAWIPSYPDDKVYDWLLGFSLPKAPSPTVGSAPTVSLTSPQFGDSFTAGTNLKLTATAADTDGTVTQVEFFEDSTLLGKATKAPYQFNWKRIPDGARTLTVKATDNSGNVVTSEPVNLSVNVVGGGSISREVWTEVSGGTIAEIPVTTKPTITDTITSLEFPAPWIGWGNNYGTRLRGYLTAPATGSYTFWIAGDDVAELWLSTDANSAKKARIAYTDTWTYPREWNKSKTQKSAPITLTKGRKVYVEVLLKEGGGGDNVAVGWLKPNQTGGSPSEVVPGMYLSPYISR